MNPENQSHFDQDESGELDARQEDRFAQMMDWLATNAAPQDPALLARLREKSTRVFIAAGDSLPEKGPDPQPLAEGSTASRERESTHKSTPTDHSAASHSMATSELPEWNKHDLKLGDHDRVTLRTPDRKRPMNLLLTRLVTVALAASILFAITYFAIHAPLTEGPAFGEVLEQMNQAASYHFLVTTADRKVEIWGKEDGRVRIDHGGGRYAIAHGPRLWNIDEPANRMTPENTPFFDAAEGKVDIVNLCWITAMTDPRVVAERILDIPPAELVQRADTNRWIYRDRVPIGDGSAGGYIEIEAVVDATSRKLQSMVITQKPAPGSAPLQNTGKRVRTELTVVDLDGPVDDGLFWVSETLTTDGRIGKVTDLQGLVTVRPVMGRRWTPIRTQFIVHPGDWIRTDLRGANAATVQLVKQGTLTLGPGTIVEMRGPREMRLLAGELQVDPQELPPNQNFTLIGPKEQTISIRRKQFYRRVQNRCVRIDTPPPWLQGYQGSAVVHSIGSLIAKVDGRDVPLSVGYHHVNVDIRDQIARTTIEQSFVNHTPVQTEGIFYFPLPEDASISGFGMWIGEELIEADIVEKQRAREIYETILRERRDPALLEWSGGNLFKARVFPIPGNSEKRIKITYTQVLPLQGGAYRYHYALESEMLRQKPLRDLLIDVQIHSALPIQEVRSPTHTVRADATAHSAHIEFTAQEYAPESDFEMVVALAERAAETVLIPHQRGEDGYFMLQLTPPAPSGQWRRELLGDHEPLELLILADTSASIHSNSRAEQADVIAALLASLSGEDTFNVACCDLDCHWIFDASRPATDAHLAEARDWLSARTSLGWTDLDTAFTAAQKRCGPATHVVYIGDGMVTTGHADPVACADRIRRHFEEHPAGTFHAIAVGNTYEPILLRGIAALGGGSFRHVTKTDTPVQVAAELLGEITQPAVRDLKIEFRNLQVARVYPDPLPNLAAGTQQIILGRYLPEGKDQVGEVIVTGTRGGRPVRYSAKVSLQDAEQGNAFIPRLWARKYLDALLQQGTSDSIQQDIIALSERYHIITPFTSLLVLESDADRERFQVKRRFQMQDGEKFFAEGRAAANYELVQQQMRRAGLWRAGLRRQTLLQFARMGRNTELFEAMVHGADRRWADPMTGPVTWGLENRSSHYRFLENYGYGTAADSAGDYLPMDVSASSSRWFQLEGFERFTNGISRSSLRGEPASSREFDWETARESSEQLILDTEPVRQLHFRSMDASFIRDGSDASIHEEGYPLGSFVTDAILPETVEKMPALRAGSQFYDRDEDLIQKRMFGTRGNLYIPPTLPSTGLELRQSVSPYAAYTDSRLGRQPYPADSIAWFNTLFPPVPPATKSGGSGSDLPATWPADAVALAQGLLRGAKLAALEGGLEIEQVCEWYNPRWNRTTARSGRLQIYAPERWLVRPSRLGEPAIITWADGNERGTLSEPFLLGRIRKSVPNDLRPAAMDLGNLPWIHQPLHQIYPNHQVTIKAQKNDGVQLILQHPDQPTLQIRWTIDTHFNAIVAEEHFQDGKRTTGKTYSDFVEVANMWWPRQIETVDGQGRCTSRIQLAYQARTADEVSKRIAEELADAGYDQALLIHQPLPSARAARHAISRNQATCDDPIALLIHFAASQRWDQACEYLEAAKELATGKPGMRWVDMAMLQARRRHEALRMRILHEAQELALAPTADQSEAADRSGDYSLAQYLVGQASGILSADEMLTLLNRLRPVCKRQPDHVEAMKYWLRQQVNYLQQINRPDEALRQWKSLANRFPHDASLQQQYAQQLAGDCQYEAAYNHLRKTIEQPNRWDRNEDYSLRNTYIQLLEQEGRWPEMVTYLADWTDRNPAQEWPYRYYLSVLIRTDQQDQADQHIRAWLEAGQTTEPLEPIVASRIEAAIQHTLGNGVNLQHQQLDPQWLGPLAATAEFLAQHPSHLNLANQIMTHGQFIKSDPGHALRIQFAKMLNEQIAELSLQQMERYTDWVWSLDPQPDQAAWQRIADELIRRWESETNTHTRHQIAQPLTRILRHRIGTEAWLAFLRHQTEDPHDRQAYSRLFEALLEQPWNPAYVDELFSLLEKVALSESEWIRPIASIVKLHRLNDHLIKSRQEYLLGQVHDLKDKPRPERIKIEQSKLRQAREELADRLGAEIVRHNDPLAQWLSAEQLVLDVRLGRNLEHVVATCWERLGTEPAFARATTDDDLDSDRAPETEIDPASKQAIQEWLDAMFRERLLAIVCAIAVRENAEPECMERLLQYVDAGIRLAVQDDGNRNARAADDTMDPSRGWRILKRDLLIAWDRPEPLEQALRKWSREQADEVLWKVSLGYLLAERGKIREAIRCWEPLEAKGLFGPDQYRTLAAWYQTVDRPAEYRRAKIEVYKTAQEWQLQNTIHSRLHPWQRTDQALPSTLDDETLLLFSALFEKSSQPQNYLWQLRSFYTATRDFRLLACLADTVVGRTAGKVYPLLEQMDSVLAEIRDEATANSIRDHLATLRHRAQTPVDHRALDLLEMLVERRAAELIDQPGPHAERALEALRRAGRHRWTSGERERMAQLLASLGAISQSDLAAEQFRQVQNLYQRAKHGSLERLRIGHHLGRLLAAYSRYDEAIDLATTALDEYLTELQNPLPRYANDVLEGIVSYLRTRKHYAQAEQVLKIHLEHADSFVQQRWLREQLFQVDQDAMVHNGRVSIGAGTAIFEPLEAQLFAALDNADPSYRHPIVKRLCSVYRASCDYPIDGAADALRNFATVRLFDVLARQTKNYESIVQTVSDTMHDTIGPEDGLICLITCIEREPKWIQWSHYNSWQQHGYRLAQWREGIKTPDQAVTERLLAIVANELRRDLRSMSSPNRHIYHQHHGYFWEAQTQAFANVAEEIYQEYRQSGAHIRYIAEYLFLGLSHYDQAIEMMLAAHQQGILDRSARWKLVEFLHQRGRFTESLPVLDQLTADDPDNLDYRLALMRGYFETGQQEPLHALRQATDTYFHANRRWNESAAARMGRACLDTRLYEQSVAYYEETIATHQRAKPHSALGDETLSRYYRELAQAYSGLKNTEKAVDAACGAIVCWSSRQNQCEQALQALDAVLRQADDLDAYAAQLDEEAEANNTEKPIVRKALGKVYLARKAYAKATAQLTLAVQSQPNDRTIHEMLVECLDQQGDPERATRQLIALAELAGRDIQLYQKIGDRLKTDQPEEAERAYTSIVEILPHESESHALLATIRAQNNRWLDAATHWERVAEIRSLEPTGLIELATAQIHLQQWDDARATLRKLQSRGWPSRFGHVDATVDQLIRQIPAMEPRGD